MISLQFWRITARKKLTLFTGNYSARSYASAEYWIYLTGQFGGVHAFGYNSAESEPIWMKSGALDLSIMLEADPGRFWARSAQ